MNVLVNRLLKDASGDAAKLREKLRSLRIEQAGARQDLRAIEADLAAVSKDDPRHKQLSQDAVVLNDSVKTIENQVVSTTSELCTVLGTAARDTIQATSKTMQGAQTSAKREILIALFMLAVSMERGGHALPDPIKEPDAFFAAIVATLAGLTPHLAAQPYYLQECAKALPNMRDGRAVFHTTREEADAAEELLTYAVHAEADADALLKLTADA